MDGDDVLAQAAVVGVRDLPGALPCKMAMLIRYGESAAASIRGSCPGRGRSTVGALRLSWLEAGVANDDFLVHAPTPPIGTPIEVAQRLAPSRGLCRGVAGAA
jgi:hypothetical protein